jgi:sugar phosphate isomerase/epimerase
VEPIAASNVVRVGPGSLPSRESADEAIQLLVTSGYDACEIDFGDGFSMDWAYADELGELIRSAGAALSIHAPLAAFLATANTVGASTTWRSGCSTTPPGSQWRAGPRRS